MRLLFLCSSLEPGRDGVGDYTRALAHACLDQGHTCALIALRDPHLQKTVAGTDREGMPFLRFPSGTGLSRTRAEAVAFRERFAPDWISLQLVAYGLHPKGLLFEPLPTLRAIVGETPLHLMLHELWLGNDEVPSLRHRIIGFLQRISLQRLISTLRPRMIATSNPVYAALLKTIGRDARISPLFGNIPITSGGSLPAALTETGIVENPDWWLGLFFGGLYPQWKPEPFFTQLARAAKKAAKHVCLVLAGNAGGDGEKIWADLVRDYSDSFRFVAVGEQPAPVVSSLMQAADFGIAASPWSVIGKSGSVASMLDHGLPVIVTRDDFQPRVRATLPPSTDPLLHRCDNKLEAKLVAGLPKRAPSARVMAIAASLGRELAEVTPERPEDGA